MLTLEQRFWQRVRKTRGCWIWTGARFKTHGNEYGHLFITRAGGKRRRALAHRYSYELHFGPIPNGKVVDHKCRNGLCVKPTHLRLKTSVENVMIGKGVPARNARKTHCKRGHKLTPKNTWNRKDGRRACRRCDRERVR